MLTWLHLQDLHFSENIMEVISIQENSFRYSSFAEFSTFENFSQPVLEPSVSRLTVTELLIRNFTEFSRFLRTFLGLPNVKIFT